MFLVSGTVVRSQENVTLTPRPRPTLTTVARTGVNLRHDVRLVQVPVVVTDLRGKPLNELERDSFRLFEDDVERDISSFMMTDAPVSATVIFDSSRSMKPRIADARAAVAIAILRQHQRPR